MNELRAEHGMPPADDFVGSSLWLVHRESPGESTLADPGLDLIDLVARRDEIKSNLQINSVCHTIVGLSRPPGQEPPRERVSLISTPGDYIESDDDWFSPIREGLVQAQAQCVAGMGGACSGIISMATRWAEADALAPGSLPRDHGKREELHWTANGVLRDLIFAYSTATELMDVNPEIHAQVLDWMKRRIDQHYFDTPGGGRLGDPGYFPTSNHATLLVQPAMAFGALVGDRSMMQPALDNWRVVLSSMRTDGSLPSETWRGARWFHYSMLQMSQLMATELVARRHGIELEPPSETQTIPALMGFVTRALADFDVAIPYARANVGPGPSRDFTVPGLYRFHFGSLPAYRELYGDDEAFLAFRDGAMDSDICGAKAREDGKFEDCDRLNDGPISIMDVVATGTEADMNLATPAGCFFGSAVNPLT